MPASDERNPRRLHEVPDEDQHTSRGAEGTVAQSEVMRAVVDLTRRVAKSNATVVVSGESGTGKERIARMLHTESSRADGQFIAINCGAVSETLLESELFGHARGAFTGALHDRPGIFEAANGGTLLLDEINSVSPAMQVKLLRAIQEREVRRVGENKVRAVDVRVVAATNKELLEAVASGTFREDLYYRLNVVTIRVPALRDRRDDILPLARVLLAGAARRMQRRELVLSPVAAASLLKYRWPGNVRELGNAMERALALATGERLQLEDLPAQVRRITAAPTDIVGPVRRLADVEKDYILAALRANNGNQTHTAEQLAIGSATLYRKLKVYRAPAPQAD